MFDLHRFTIPQLAGAAVKTFWRERLAMPKPEICIDGVLVSIILFDGFPLAKICFRCFQRTNVIGADTVVVRGDTILEKPQDSCNSSNSKISPIDRRLRP